MYDLRTVVSLPTPFLSNFCVPSDRYLGKKLALVWSISGSESRGVSRHYALATSPEVFVTSSILLFLHSSTGKFPLGQSASQIKTGCGSMFYAGQRTWNHKWNKIQDFIRLKPPKKTNPLFFRWKCLYKCETFTYWCIRDYCFYLFNCDTKSSVHGL